MYIIFFFKQNTAYGMRISDWSSDVCSSDLPEVIMTFSSHSIMNFSLAGFQFTKGTLQFRAGDEERLAAFEKLYDSLPPMEKNRIKKNDGAAAEKLLAELKAKEGEIGRAHV